MKLPNQNNSDDSITIIKSADRKDHVWLAIGDDKRSCHAHLLPAEAKAVAYALLSYAEHVSIITVDQQFANEEERRI